MLEILSPLGGGPLATGWIRPDSQDRPLCQNAVAAGDNVECDRNDREHCDKPQHDESEVVPPTTVIMSPFSAVGEMVDEGEDQQDQLDEVRGSADEEKGARHLHPGGKTRGLLLPAHWAAAADHRAADHAEDAGEHGDRAKRPVRTGNECDACEGERQGAEARRRVYFGQKVRVIAAHA